MKEKDHYKILNVDPEADPVVITAAFRALARKLHPDVDFTGVDEYRMSELNHSYQILRDPAERKAYDLRRVFKLTPVGPGAARRMEEAEGTSHLSERVHARQDEIDTAGQARLDFGRYSGETLQDIARIDPDYLRWLSRHSSGIRFRAAITRLLNERTGDPYSRRPSR